MKKLFILFSVVFACVPVWAGDTLHCEGQAIIRYIAVPNPILRDVEMSLTSSSDKSGSFEIGVGGDPLVYQGALDLSGNTANTIINSDNGDVTDVFILHYPGGLELTILFKTKAGKQVGKLETSQLTCH